MYRKLVIILAVLLVVGAMTTTVFAGRTPRLREVDYSLGSLIADGIFTALGNEDVEVTLDATGIAEVICTNQGGNEAPGQNPEVSAVGRTLILSDQITKNGTASFTVETEALQPLSAREAGCPNDNWTANVDFVFWTESTITVTSLATGEEQFSQDFTCVTTHNPDTVTCTAVH